MRYRHIVTVGTVLISIFVLLAALMYYFNQGYCPLGTFLCQNSSLCIPQRSWCDNRHDCPGGDDEDACSDSHGDWYWYSKIRRPPVQFVCPNVTKKDPGYHINCEYANCIVHCEKFPASYITESFSQNLTTIKISKSAINILKQTYFHRYTNLRSLYLQHNHIQILEQDVFVKQQDLIWLIMSHNVIEEISGGHLTGLLNLETLAIDDNSIHTLDLRDLENSTKFEMLDASRNLLRLSNLSLPYLPALRELVLDENRLEEITDSIFSNLPMLSSLTLESNLIERISFGAFENSRHLKDLNLMHNKIIEIAPDLFVPVGNLTNLKMGYNQIENLPESAFDPLQTNLESLGVEEIDLDNIEKNYFNKFPKLDFVYFKRFHYCTAYASNIKKCTPAMDGVSSLSHLLGKPLLRTAVWCISCATCLGNALVLWGRFTARDENRVLSIIIRNLAVSDMFMGLYLLMVALADMRFRNNYRQEANTWISSWSCTCLGMLAMTSSEVSVLILSFMSVERFLLIAAPLKGHRAITSQTAATSMIVVWVVGVTLAIFPVVNWRSSTRFYGLNGMCFPLHIDDPFLVGWQYSAFIFLGINLFGLITIGYVYAGMFASIWRTRHATPLSVGDSEFALRFFLIVLTDAVCWAPIIILKIMALAQYPVGTDLTSWVVVFVLPVNSAVNPLLYTFTTPKFRERLNEGWFGKMRNIVSRKQSRSDSQISYTCTTNKNMTMSVCNYKNDEKILKPSLNETLLIDFITKDK